MKEKYAKENSKIGTISLFLHMATAKEKKKKEEYEKKTVTE